MKKRLLITSALMTAVLGASLATGTYAWYAVSTNRAQMTSVVGSVGSKVDVDSIAAAGLVGTFSTLDQVDLSDYTGKSYYLSGTKAFLDSEADIENKGTFTIDWADDTTAEQMAASAGTYTITITAGGQVYLSETENSAYNGVKTLTYDVTIAPDGTITGGTVEFYYSVRAKNTGTGNNETADQPSDHSEDKVTASLA